MQVVALPFPSGDHKGPPSLALPPSPLQLGSVRQTRLYHWCYNGSGIFLFK